MLKVSGQSPIVGGINRSSEGADSRSLEVQVDRVGHLADIQHLTRRKERRKGQVELRFEGEGHIQVGLLRKSTVGKASHAQSNV